MPDFKEDLLQFIWKQRLLKPVTLRSTSGIEIRIIRPGEQNFHSGPDFSNAKILIGNVLLAGNVELHLRSSDWLRHNHQADAAYDKIILHVVYDHDMEIPQNVNFGVEVLEVKEYIDPATIKAYENLSSNGLQLPCSGQLKRVQDFRYISWLERMAVERLEKKTQRIQQYFEDFRSDYAQTFYCLLVRNFGFNTNAAPFELLARQLPVHTLLKYSDDQVQLESLLLGYAGMLDEQYEDDYMRQLQNDFEFKKRKYSLVPLKKEIFKYSRMRPANFPNVRLVQLAALIHRHPELFSAPHRFQTHDQLLDLFRIEPSFYWQKRFIPDVKEGDRNIKAGRQSAENLMINTFAPFFFFYGKKLAKSEFQNAAIELLNNCAAENNVRTRLYAAKSGLHINAASSQGLLNLYDNYCSHKRCLNCGITGALLKSA